PQHLALQPRCAAAGELVAFQHLQQRGQAVSALAAELADPAMEEVLRGPAVAQRAVDREGELGTRRGAGEIDDRACGAERRYAADVTDIESSELEGRVHVVRTAMCLAAT